MKKTTRNKLFAAWAWCDHYDKSTEFMLSFMADEAGVEYDRAVNFIIDTPEEQRNQWYKDNPNWLEQWKKDHTI